MWVAVASLFRLRGRWRQGQRRDRRRRKRALDGFFVGVRGPGGGYLLGRDMSALSVAEIILAVDEPLDATQCGGKENCHDDGKCITHDLWASLNGRIFDYLGGVTLQQLVDNQRAKESGVSPMIDMRPSVNKRAAVSA